MISYSLLQNRSVNLAQENPQISKTAQLFYKVLLREIKGLKANFSQKWRQTGAADYEKVTWGFFLPA